MQLLYATAWHDFVTWRASDGVYSGVWAWTPDRGAYRFLTFPGDWSRGVEGFGTDGTQMVWVYGEGKGPRQEPYPKRSIMVAPFARDPLALAPKRVRSFPSSESIILPSTVGCGYAAIETSASSVLVVRLNDGVSWEIRAPTADAGKSWHFTGAFAITCDEVFVGGGVAPAMNIARVRLDALGPGTPPD